MRWIFEVVGPWQLLSMYSIVIILGGGFRCI